MQQTIPVNDAWISSHVGATPSTGPFQVDFPFFSLNDVVVTRQADGTLVQEALTRGADYDIAGVATEDGSFSSGTVTLYLAVSNSTVTRFRTTPVERLSNFPLQGFFSRLALNAELNKITVWMQELHGLLGTTSEASQAHAPIVSPFFVGDPRAPTPLPGDNDTSLATTAFVQAALVGVGAAVPSGVILDFAGGVVPGGWLLCTGQTLNKAAYPGLFTALGTTYNVGGEAGTDFRLPDLRGRFVAAPDSGGSNRLNVQVANSGVVGSSGGSQEHVLLGTELASHNHGGVDHLHAMTNHTHTFPSWGSPVFITGGGAANFIGYASGVAGGGQLGYDAGPGGMTAALNTGAADRSLTSGYFGGSGAHNNVPPVIILNKIIKT